MGITTFLPITATDGYVSAEILIDDDDYDFLREQEMFIDSDGYPVARYRGRLVRVHRLIAQRASGVPSAAIAGVLIDHINGDRLDNRRANLRPANYSQNAANTGPRQCRQYKGVYPRHGRYRAAIKVNYKQYNLGVYDTPEEAAKAYDQAAYDAWGEFAYLNFPEQVKRGRR